MAAAPVMKKVFIAFSDKGSENSALEINSPPTSVLYQNSRAFYLVEES